MADVGTGASIAFGTTSWTAQVTSISGTDISRSSHDTSHLGTSTWRTKIPGDLVDPGGLDVDILVSSDQFTAGTGVQYCAPITATAETITVYFPGTNTTATNNLRVSGTGFVENWSWGIPLEDLMTASLHVQFSGKTTWTAGT